MNRTKLKFLVIFLIIGSSCAHVHKRVPRKEPTPLLISGSVIDQYTTRHFKFIEFTFENTSNSWARLKNLKLDLGDPFLNDNVIITSGRDLGAWIEGIKNMRDIDEHNKKILWSFIFSTASSIAPSLSRAPHGAWYHVDAVANGLANAMAISTFNQDLERLRNVNVFPDSHLYSGDLAVPAGLFLRRWMVVYIPDPKVDFYTANPTLSYVNESGATQSTKLQL